MFDEGRRSGLNASPPSQTGQAVLPHPAFRSMVSRWTGSGTRHKALEGIAPAAQWLPTRSPLPGRSTGRFPAAASVRFSGAFGRSALRHYPNPCERCHGSAPPPLSYVPSLHGRYPLPRYYGRADPDRLFRRRLPWFPDSRHQNFRPFRLQPSTVLHQPRPLPQRWQLYFVRASSVARRLAKTADRIEFTLAAASGCRCYRLVVRFPLLSTRGSRPDAVTFSYWPYSVGQVRDLHPAVPVRSQAHKRRAWPALSAAS